jgi:hypothetical protein
VLAADEAVTNVIRHTYQGAPDKPILLSARNHRRPSAPAPARLRASRRRPETLKGRELEDIKPGGWVVQDSNLQPSA